VQKSERLSGGPVVREPTQYDVFLAYAPENENAVAMLARRLQGDAHFSFWFAPWHAIPGVPLQEQMEEALIQAQCCAVFVVSGEDGVKGWQNEQLRTAIQTRVEDQAHYRVIPVLLPGVQRPSRRALPPFLRRYEPVEFRALDDEQAFKRLLAGLLGLRPLDVEGYLASKASAEPAPAGGRVLSEPLQLPLPPAAGPDAATTRRSPPLDDEQRRHLEALRRDHQRRLQVLERQQATQGLQTPPQILTEIEDILAAITTIEARLGADPTAMV